MGWTFSYTDVGRKAHIEYLTSAKHFSEGYTPLEHRVVGNNVWQLVRIDATGRKMITLDLIAKQRGEGWGYKGLTEDMGPVEVNCPLSLLNKASPVTEGYAVEWREKVRRYHAAQAAYRKAKKPGTVVVYGGVEYTLVAPDRWRRGRWSAISAADGQTYSMKATQLARSTLKPRPMRQMELPIEFAGEGA
jgi:hypothetical protein